MRQPTHRELMSIWDRAGSRHPVNRAMALLAAAYPDVDGETLARLPVGRRDDRLLALRARLFGPVITTVVHCPSCAEQLELTIDVAGLRSLGQEAAGAGEHTVTEGAYEVTIRLPDSLDLLAAAASPDVSHAETLLLARCVRSARRDGGEVGVGDLPPPVVDAVTDAMERADPLANIELSSLCRGCGHEWRLAFDVTSYLWDELTAWVVRVAREVDALASRYGWSEADILAMSPRHRRLYLELAAL